MERIPKQPTPDEISQTIQKGAELAEKRMEDMKHHEKAEEMMTGDQKIMSEEREATFVHGYNEVFEKEISRRLELAEEKISGFFKENLGEYYYGKSACIACAASKAFFTESDMWRVLEKRADVTDFTDPAFYDSEYFKKKFTEEDKLGLMNLKKFTEGLVETVNSAAESIGVTSYLSLTKVWEAMGKDDDNFLRLSSNLNRMRKNLEEELFVKK